MTVLIVENAPNNLKGKICLWLLEVKSGVFVGNISSRVRDLLWDKVCSNKNQPALLVFNYNNEQGFDFKINGDPIRSIIDFDGVKLIKRKITV